MAEQRSNRLLYGALTTAALLMFGFCFAIVPFYSAICRATGINTATREELSTKTDSNAGVDLTREVEVQFVAMTNMGMPWDFYPRIKSIKVHPGENNRVYFHAKNTTGKDMLVQAIPSMTPTESLSHFHKIQCFCFNQQSLRAYEGREMPLVFNVDRNLPKEIRVITLAYTLFDVTPKESKKG